MKKFLVTLIYASLATLVVGYLFLVLQIQGFQDVALGAFWLHTIAYIGYSLLVPYKDGRMIYPISLLLIAVAIQVFNIPINNFISPLNLSILIFIIFMSYCAFHLLIKDYLGENDLKLLPKINIASLALILLATLFKIAKLPKVTELMVIGCGAVALMLLFTGVTKGLKREKKT